MCPIFWVLHTYLIKPLIFRDIRVKQHWLIAKKRAVFCVLLEILAISIEQEWVHKQRRRSRWRGSRIFHIFGGKKFITADFTIVSSGVACCLFHLESLTDINVP